MFSQSIASPKDRIVIGRRNQVEGGEHGSDHFTHNQSSMAGLFYLPDGGAGDEFTTRVSIDEFATRAGVMAHTVGIKEARTAPRPGDRGIGKTGYWPSGGKAGHGGWCRGSKRTALFSGTARGVTAWLPGDPASRATQIRLRLRCAFAPWRFFKKVLCGKSGSSAVVGTAQIGKSVAERLLL